MSVNLELDCLLGDFFQRECCWPDFRFCLGFVLAIFSKGYSYIITILVAHRWKLGREITLGRHERLLPCGFRWSWNLGYRTRTSLCFWSGDGQVNATELFKQCNVASFSSWYAVCKWLYFFFLILNRSICLSSLCKYSENKCQPF